MIRTTGIVILSLSLSALPSYAADGKRDTATAAPADLARTNVGHVANIKTTSVIWSTGLVGMADGDSISAVASDSDWSLPPVEFGSAKRPAALPALYVSLAVLQAFDAYETRRGLAAGTREANSLMQGVVGQPAAFWALKAATTAGAVVAAEHLWKTNKAAAIAVMVIANGVSAAVAARNASVLKQQR